MRIAYVSGLGRVWGSYAPWVLDRTDSGTVAGGEGAFLNTAFALAQRGHLVTCFYPGAEAVYRGVRFRPQEDATVSVLTDPWDALVSWSDEKIIRIAPAYMVRAYSQQLNDMPRDIGFWGNVDVLISPSMTHLRFLDLWRPENASVAYCAMGAGVDPARFAAQKPFGARKHVVSWWSSPDRGLHHLLLMWPEIRRQVPDAELRIFYHLDRFIASTRNAIEYMQDIPWRARILEALTGPLQPGVSIHGAIPRLELAKHQIETKCWAFPFDPAVATEGFSVAFLESLAAGCWAIARSDDALPELYGDAAQWIEDEDGLCGDVFRRRFADAVVFALLAHENPYESAQRDIVRQFTWENSAIQIERALRTRTPGKVNTMGGTV